MKDVNVSIEIDSGIWAINIIHSKDDRIWDLTTSKKSDTFKFDENKTTPIFANIAATQGTKFKIKADDEVVIEGETDKENLWTGYGFIFT